MPGYKHLDIYFKKIKFVFSIHLHHASYVFTREIKEIRRHSMICVDYILAAFTDIDLKAFEIPKLRGYFAHKYPDEPLLHNQIGRAHV